MEVEKKKTSNHGRPNRNFYHKKRWPRNASDGKKKSLSNKKKKTNDAENLGRISKRGSQKNEEEECSDFEQCCSQVRRQIFDGQFSEDIISIAAEKDELLKQLSGKSSTSDFAKSASNCRLFMDRISPYKGWSHYFPLEKFVVNDERHQITELSKRYLINVQEKFDAYRIIRKKLFTISFPHFYDYFAKNAGTNLDLKERMINSPDLVINCVGLAMHTLISEHLGQKDDESSTKSNRVELFPIINVRFVDFDHPQPIKSITLSNFNKFVVVQGVVTKTANIGPKCLSLSFECATCNKIQTLVLPDDGSYLNPDRCGDLECRGRLFKPILSSTDYSAKYQPRTVDRCRLILRDQDELCKSSSDFDHTERVGEPPTLECELTDDLANNCPIPGSFVVICGVLKLQALQGENRRSSKGGQQNSFKMILHANSIRLNCRERLDSFETQLMFSQQQNESENLIDYVKNSPNVFGLLIDSLCSHIYGYQFIKAGLLLALVGSGREHDGGEQFRDTIHVLIIGDPGLGKTHLLQACALTSPRGIYLSGKTTTVAGLTVALNRDNGKTSGGNDMAVEAGALVMADGGCCCLDEFDKMSMQHHSALLEAMEQQQVSVAKAGAHCQFPARTSIVAAANPIGGRYNDKGSSSLLSNNSPPSAFSSTKFVRPLLNRFDLIFSLRDYASLERDRAITEHLMRARNNEDCKKRILSVDELRQYIAKVKEQSAPKMDVKAAKMLLNYFESFRTSKLNSNENALVGIRQFESLVRLTRARARCEFSPICTEKHAADVLEIVKENGADINRRANENDIGSPSSPAGYNKRMKSNKNSKESRELLMKNLTRLVNLKCDSLLTTNELKDAYKNQFESSDDALFGRVLNDLNESGYIIKKGLDLYQILRV